MPTDLLAVVSKRATTTPRLPIISPEKRIAEVVRLREVSFVPEARVRLGLRHLSLPIETVGNLRRISNSIDLALPVDGEGEILQLDQIILGFGNTRSSVVTVDVFQYALSKRVKFNPLTLIFTSPTQE